ncbi:hypothetical protein [Salipaludibacillus daqingensis]|uniref:hypothetical protein n=1 Tax=Salipaludibacillus daqingensis TaxID=3041001 RepID=UPI003144F293
MNIELMPKNGALPCEVTADDDNGVFTIRKEDTSGEVFNNFSSLKGWIHQHWNEEQFVHSNEFHQLLSFLDQYEKEM